MTYTAGQSHGSFSPIEVSFSQMNLACVSLTKKKNHNSWFISFTAISDTFSKMYSNAIYKFILPAVMKVMI